MQSKEVKRSQRAYILQCMFEYFVSLLVMDVYLAKVMAVVGIDDALTGVVSTITSLMVQTQLLSIVIIPRLKSVKGAVILFNTLGLLCFMTLYLIPILPFGFVFKRNAIVLCMLFGYFFRYALAPIRARWQNSFVEPDRRGSFCAILGRVSLIASMPFVLSVGFVLDHFEKSGKIQTGLLVVAAIISLSCVCNLVCLLCISKPREKLVVETASIKQVLAYLWNNKSYRMVFLLLVLYHVSNPVSGFLGTYKIKELMISVGMVQVMNIGGSIVQFIALKPFGKFEDRTSFATGMKAAMTLRVISLSAVLFCTPGTRWLILVYILVDNAAVAGLTYCIQNILYNYVDKQYIVQADAISGGITMPLGFGAALAGGRVLSYVQTHENMVWGMKMYGQQLLAGISILISIVVILYIRFVIEKRPVMKQ